MEDIKISLITTLYNEEDNIDKFLESYRNQTKYAYEFIIVDGGSSDKTVEKIENFINENRNLNIKLIIDRKCSKKYVKGPIAKGRNIAIDNAECEYIAVTDAGCILDKNWLIEISKPFRDKDIDIVSGWYEANITNEFQKVYSDIYMRKLQKLNLDNFLPSSRSLAFKKCCWKRVGGYPTDSMTAEDTVFDLKLKKNNCQFKFSSKAVVYWNCPKNHNEALQKADYYAFGDGHHKLFFKKFLYRNILLFFPINIILSKLRRKQFRLTYGIMLRYQMGYLKGLLK